MYPRNADLRVEGNEVR